MNNFIAHRKFIFSMSTVVVVTFFFWLMKYDAVVYRDIIIAVAGFYIGAQAYVDSKKGGEQ